MTQTEYRCKTCGGSPSDDESFDCPACGRPIGLCAECGFPLWLSPGGDLPDCDECRAFEGMLLSREEQEQRRLDWGRRRQRARLIRETANERGRELSGIVAAAYRAAGRPRRVVRLWKGDFVHEVRSGSRRYEYEPATEAEWDAWQAWQRERARLRQELGVNRGGFRPHASEVADSTPESEG